MTNIEKIKDEIESHEQEIKLSIIKIERLKELLDNPDVDNNYIRGLRLKDLSSYHFDLLELEHKIESMYGDTIDKHLDWYYSASEYIKWECLEWVYDTIQKNPSMSDTEIVNDFGTKMRMSQETYKLSAGSRSNPWTIKVSLGILRCEECGEWYEPYSNTVDSKYCSRKCYKKAANRRAKIAREAKKNDI